MILDLGLKLRRPPTLTMPGGTRSTASPSQFEKKQGHGGTRPSRLPTPSQHGFCLGGYRQHRVMSTETVVKLVEEMVDLKVQYFAESMMKTTPEVARLLHEKRATDRRRLEQIKAELVRLLDTNFHG